jgi:hypothetical protein
MRYNVKEPILEGAAMQPDMQTEPNEKERVCPGCGFEEDGYFCRNCGTLLRGGERVLCPRCHQVVPGGGFCNKCGQDVSDFALSLRQLAMAGETFWVTEGMAEPTPSLEPDVLPPDESVELADADLPYWLPRLPTESAPADVEERIYPALRPLGRKRTSGQQGRFLALAVLVMGLLLLGLMGTAFAIILLRAGG